MSMAMSFVGPDFLDRPPPAPGPGIPGPGFAARLAAEADDLRALLLLLGRTDPARCWSRSGIVALLARVLKGLDQAINRQLNAILHHPELQALEGNWRGLKLLTDQAEHNDSEGLVRVKVLDLSWRELSRDLARAIEFDQSRLFAKIYSEEFGSPGGEPFGLLLGAYSISHRSGGGQATLDTLRELAQLGAAAFAPVVLNAAPSFFGVDRYVELSAVPELESHFDQPELAGWRALRRHEDARFLGLALPRMLMRQPYRDQGWGPEAFRFREEQSDPDRDFLWGHACFAVAAVAVRAFCESGWFAQIKGYRAGQVAHGTIDNLPAVQRITATEQLYATRNPVDWQITERMDKVLADAGFVPLMPLADTEMLVLHSVPSVQQPPAYEKAEARVSGRLSSMLHYTLCVSRFAHYLKVMGRDRIGDYRTPEECETQLQRWLHGYTMATEGASDELRARFPLRDARVSVKTRPDAPGRFFSVIRLQPHFQLDQLITGIRLVTELSPVAE